MGGLQVGTTKDQGLYNKPSAAVHPGALAAGTLPQYNTVQVRFLCVIRHPTVGIAEEVVTSRERDIVLRLRTLPPWLRS